MSVHEYPDFEYFEKVLWGNILQEHPEFKGNVRMHEYSADMFPQSWASTAGGFEEPGMMAGQMITTEYTTVMELRLFIGKEAVEHCFWGVFFGDKPAYLVFDPKEQFFKDLKNRRMKSRYEAKDAY